MTRFDTNLDVNETYKVGYLQVYSSEGFFMYMLTRLYTHLDVGFFTGLVIILLILKVLYV